MSQQNCNGFEDFDEFDNFDDIKSFESVNDINGNINFFEGLEEFERFEDFEGFNNFQEKAIKPSFYDERSNHAEFIINGNDFINCGYKEDKYSDYDECHQCDTDFDKRNKCDPCNKNLSKDDYCKCTTKDKESDNFQNDKCNRCENKWQEYYGQNYYNEREEGFKEGYMAALKKCENSNFMFRRGFKIGCNAGYRKGFSDAFRKIMKRIACFRGKCHR